MDGLDSRIDPDTGKKRRGRPPKPRIDGTLPPPKRKRVDEYGNPIPKGSNPIDPVTGKKKRGRPKKSDMPPGMSMPPGHQGQGVVMQNSMQPLNKMVKHDYNGVVRDDGGDSDAPSSVSKTPTRLPPFSPNFRGMSSLTGEEEGGVDCGPEHRASLDDRLRPSLDGDEGAKDMSQPPPDHMSDHLSSRLGHAPHEPPHPS